MKSTALKIGVGHKMGYSCEFLKKSQEVRAIHVLDQIAAMGREFFERSTVALVLATVKLFFPIPIGECVDLLHYRPKFVMLECIIQNNVGEGIVVQVLPV
jgi:hypothetical protein